MSRLAQGTRVAFSAAWGKSTGADQPTMALRGVIVGAEDSPAFRGLGFVYVLWDGAAAPRLVNSAALARVGSAKFGDTYAP